MKILHATLEAKWFHMILSGIKKEEYQTIKPYWIKRLLNADFEDDRQFVFDDNQRDYDAIQFTNGYGTHAPRIRMHYHGVKVGNTKPEWSAGYMTEVFVLSLGKIIEIKNVSSVNLCMSAILKKDMPPCAEVIELQRILNLPQDGNFGHSTYDALLKKYSADSIDNFTLNALLTLGEEGVRNAIPLHEIHWLKSAKA